MAGGVTITTILLGVLAIFLIIELGLTAYVVSDWAGGWWRNHTPSSFSFMLFSTIWSILVLIYLALAQSILPRIYHRFVALGLLGVTTIFWFAGSIAMADYIGVPRCRGNTYCHSSQAAVAFGFFIWAIFTALTVIEGLSFMKNRGPSAHADKTSSRV